MTPTVSLILPTRGPLDLLAEAVASLAATTDDPARVELVARVDTDDPDRRFRVRAACDWPGPRRVLEGPRGPMGTMTAECLEAATGAWAWLVNDDLIHETFGWDRLLAETIAARGDYGPECCYFPDDSVLGPMLCCFPVFPRAHAVATAFFGCGEIERYGIDAVIAELYGNHLRRLCYVPDWVVRHAHLADAAPEGGRNPMTWCAFDHGGRTYYAQRDIAERDNGRVAAIFATIPAMASVVRASRYPAGAGT